MLEKLSKLLSFQSQDEIKEGSINITFLLFRHLHFTLFIQFTPLAGNSRNMRKLPQDLFHCNLLLGT